jgi:hypothetical protein
MILKMHFSSPVISKFSESNFQKDIRKWLTSNNALWCFLEVPENLFQKFPKKGIFALNK